jgi:transaldolase
MQWRDNMTKIFIDTANIDEIREISKWGIFQGITTNQTIFLKAKEAASHKFDYMDRVVEILNFNKNMPVSLEANGSTADELLGEASAIINLLDENSRRFDNIVIKIPMLPNGEGLKAVRVLSEMHVKTNVTACMCLNQLQLAASAGATYVSLFYNRMKDWADTQKDWKKQDYPLKTIAFANNVLMDTKTKLIVGSIRSSADIEELLTLSPHIITIPPKILYQMCYHEKTQQTLEEFDKNWKEFCKQ